MATELNHFTLHYVKLVTGKAGVDGCAAYLHLACTRKDLQLYAAQMANVVKELPDGDRDYLRLMYKKFYRELDR